MTTRRDVLKQIGAGAAASALAPWASLAAGLEGAARRPNILFIMTDQQFAGAMSCAGNRYLRTPAMDSLAETGVRFENAYCAQPLCVPSRTAMMTGRMPHETGIMENSSAKRDRVRVPMLGAVFAAAGYDCGYAGKWHLPVPAGQTELHGFARVEQKGDSHVAAVGADFVGRKHSRPFLFAASFVNPHDICQWARGEEHPQGPIPDPPPPEQCPPLPENFEIPAGEPEIIRTVQREQTRIHPTLDWQPERWRQYRWAYYRLIEKVDAQIGSILEALRKSGQEADTLVVFSADHGDGSGAHHWNQKSVLYEEAVRVPWIVSLKGVTRGGHADRAHLVSTGLDLIPTLCDYAGIEVPSGLRGRSVRAIADGRPPGQWRDCVVTETVFDKTRAAGRLLRTNRYKYVVYAEGRRREQLFDIQQDPGEMQSLVDDPAARQILEEHRNRLAAWCAETSDHFPLVAGKANP